MMRWWKLVLEEPFRVFFPLGMLAGVHGVMVWPLHYAGRLDFNPIDAHPRLMIEGMMAAFVVGFLGTAFPRLAGNRSWFGAEFLLLLGLWLAATIQAARGQVAAADGWFAAMLGCVFIGLAVRWVLGRRDTPPPGFPLALAGLLGGMVAAACLAWDHGRWMGLEGVTWAKLWLFQGLIVLPVMGVGPYLLPRFFGQPSTHAFDDSPTPPPGWWPRVGSAVFWGLHLLASFALEVKGYPQLGQILRALVILVWFALETPVFRPAAEPSTAASLVRLAVILFASGWLMAAFLPQARIGSLHLAFIGGFGLLVATASMRVILGHAGRHDLITGKRVWLRWFALLVVLAATTRTSADFLEKVRVSHHIYAAWTWLAVVLLWFWMLGKFLFLDEESATRRGVCPRRRGRPAG